MIQPGDIVLYPVGPTSVWLSKLVGWGQRVIGQAPSVKEYSHVAMVGPDSAHIYQAYWPRIENSQLVLNGNEIYRIKDIAPDQIAKMMAYCQSQVGKLYDMAAILTFGLLHLGGTEVCSELIYNAALAGGVVLYPPEYFESPDDVAASDKLIRIV